MLQIRRLPSGRFLYTLIITIILGVMIPVPHASGQDTTGKVVLSGINCDSFPTMAVEFEVYDPSGGFVTDLQPGDVTIQEEGLDAQEIYTIVGAAETDPADGLISNESPLGKALLNHKAGDRVQVDAPAGAFTILVAKVE